ncbi:MAG: alpha-amylase family glycosyl hydrolase [Candidatus Xenobia bacterium]
MATISGDACAAPASPIATDPAASFRQRAWQDETIYMIMTDRFKDGDKTNDQDCDKSNPDKFHGGDWQGIINKLDDLKKLGVTTLWITPPQLQVMLDKPIKFGQDGYHGYWAKDFFKTDPHFGTMDKLKELVEKAHQKGMKVVVDFVVNHTGYGAPMSQDPEKHDWFHHMGVQKGTSQYWFEHGQLAGLPDFAQENPDCARWLIDMCKWWIDQTGMDGMRLDAARHVPIKFWKQFSEEIHQHAGNNFLLLGEVYHGNPKVVAPYQEPLDSVFDFPLNFAVRDNIGHNESSSRVGRLKYFAEHVWIHPGESFRMLMQPNDSDMRRIFKVIDQDDLYRRPDMLVTMVDNHDMTRFFSAAGPHGEDKLKMALSLIFTMRGIPCVYMGTESATPGEFGHTRDDINFERNPEMQRWFSHLAHVREDHVALRRGRVEELMASKTALAYARVHPQETMVVAFNNDSEPQKLHVPAPKSLPEGSTLSDTETGELYRVQNGFIDMTLPPLKAAVLAPAKPAEESPSLVQQPGGSK